MNIDYQSLVDTLTSLMMVAFPIALIFMIVQKIIGIFVSFVFGKDVTF